ncbi:MAG: 8-amino-7-oxononanoate synthase [Parasphingorhabdus sp.]|jgi:8-amino-7-oxononanoate synthase
MTDSDIGYWQTHLRSRLQSRIETNQLRQHRIVEGEQRVDIAIAGEQVVNFSSNDYLGLAADEGLKRQHLDGTQAFGVGAAASHLVSGHMTAHEGLEHSISEYLGAEKVLLFSSGYQANIGLLTALANRHSLLVTDRLNHASLIDAAILSRARVKRYKHNDWRGAEAYLQSAGANSILVTDSVFSMDGDIAPLQKLNEICLTRGALLVVDEAHGFGVLGEGRGALAEAGIKPRANVVMMGTLGKAAGVFGAFIAADKIIIDTIIQFARAYIYSTALPPALAYAATYSIKVIQQDTDRRHRLRSNIQLFRALCKTAAIPLLNSSTPIQPLMIGDESRALEIADKLQQDGFLVIAIRPPTVPRGTSRLRVTLSAAHVPAQIQSLVQSLGKCLK